MSLRPLESDWNRHRFLTLLDESTTIALNDWEFDFVTDCAPQTTFSPKQRAVIDKMYANYNWQLGFDPEDDNVPF